jgi:uncharacterized membrane protein
MATVEQTIDVDAPIGAVYEQWTHFETFPSFMDGVERVEWNQDRTLEWWATVGGVEKHWRATITDFSPNERIAWESIDGAQNSGVVRFAPIGSDRTRISLKIEAEPEGLIEKVGEATGFLERRVAADLEAFKEFMETQPTVREPELTRS